MGSDNQNSNIRPKAEKILLSAALILIIAVAVLIRYRYAGEREFIYDEAYYAWSADRLAGDLSLVSSEEINEYHPPLFPILLMLGKTHSGPPFSPTPFFPAMVVISVVGVLAFFVAGWRISSGFLAFFCALSWALHPVYVINSAYLLNDIPFAVMAIFLLSALSEAGKKDHWRVDIGVGIAIALMISIKYTGLLMIPFVAIFYLFLPKTLTAVKLRKLATALLVPVLIVIIFGVNNYINRGTIFPALSAFSGRVIGLKYMGLIIRYYATEYALPVLLAGFIFGLYFILRRNIYFEKLLVVYIVIGFGSLIPLHEHDFRYGLFLLPAILLISGLGFEGLLTTFLKGSRFGLFAKIAVISFLGIYYSNFLPLMDRFVNHKAQFSKYSEAGAWTRSHLKEKTIVISQEARIMRYLTGINFQRFWGRVVALPSDKPEIAALLGQVNSHAILDVDRTREKGSDDFLPFSKPEEEENFLRSYGFYLKHTVYQEINCSATVSRPCEPVPMIKIFEHQ